MLSFCFLSGSNSKSFLRVIELRNVPWIFLKKIIRQGLCPSKWVHTFKDNTLLHIDGILSPGGEEPHLWKSFSVCDLREELLLAASAGAHVDSVHTHSAPALELCIL